MSEQIPSVEPAPVAPNLAPTKNTLGLVALILGIASMVLFWLAPVAILLAAGAIAFGILGIRRAKTINVGRVRSVWGLVLGAIALPLAVIVLIASAQALQAGVEDGLNAVPGGNTTSASPTETEEAPDPETPTPTPTKEQAAPSKEPAPVQDYAELSEREFALLVKNPDAAKKQKIIIYGVISQFDSATGPCSFLASVAFATQESTWDYAQNSWFDGGDGKKNCPLLDDIVEGDHVKLWATTAGSLSYDTQIGGSTTVPRFDVDKIELLPALEF